MFETNDSCSNLQAIIAQYTHLKNNEVSNTTQIVNGRVVKFRRHGSIAFAQLATIDGEIQIFFQKNETTFYNNRDGYDNVKNIKLGDWIKVSGLIGKTSTGEISIYARTFSCLAKTEISWPDKHVGISNIDTRYRNRSLDFWVNPQARDIIVERSKIIRAIREFMWNSGFTEVETPMLHPIKGGASAKPFVTHHNALGEDFFMRIAPELYLKRLVAGGMGDIFEIGKVFRNEGISHKHNPEFTTIEAYAQSNNIFQIVNLISEMLGSILGEDFAKLVRHANMCELISEQVGREVNFENTTGEEIQNLYETRVEPNIVEPTFVFGHPITSSPLAQSVYNYPQIADRFELVVGGVEIANGFQELADSKIQLSNFMAQASKGEDGDEEAMMVDYEYIEALEVGLPPTVGFGIGIDRLVMLATNSDNIKDVIAFPTLKRRKD